MVWQMAWDVVDSSQHGYSLELLDHTSLGPGSPNKLGLSPLVNWLFPKTRDE